MTGHEPYLVARLFREFPDVYDAYRLRVVARLLEDDPRAGSFKSRRERTRAQRVARMTGRVRK